MGEFTKKNVSELKDSAPQFGFEEIAEARFPAKELDASQAGFAHHRLRPNKRQAFGHKHDEAEEICFVVAGSGRVKLDEEIVELEQGDFLRVAAPVKRRFEAGPDGLEYIVFGASFEKDGELDPGFWAPDES
jgi:mannose-6-phosphate isomerase-like protein (cupin superfamily)